MGDEYPEGFLRGFEPDLPGGGGCPSGRFFSGMVRSTDSCRCIAFWKESSAEGKWQRPGNRDAFAGKNAEHLGEEVEAENRKEQETLLMAEAEEVGRKKPFRRKKSFKRKRNPKEERSGRGRNGREKSCGKQKK